MKKLGKFELDRIYCGDCKNLLKQLPDKKIDMCITSPPYWGLRDYGMEGIIWGGDENCKHIWGEKSITLHHKSGETNPGLEGSWKDRGASDDKGNYFCLKCGAWKGSLGLEPDFNLYIKHLCDIFDEVKRVLKKEGTCWVNIGDTYHGGNLCVGQPENWESLSTVNKEKYNSSVFNKFIKDRNKMNYPKKSLIMIPFRFAIEMVNRGWILRNVIIWHKPNCMPSSATDRFTVDFEYLFFFSKSKKYYFEQQVEPWTDKNKHDVERAIYGHKEYKGKYQLNKKGSFSMSKSSVVGDPLIGRNKRTVWSINTEPFKEAHFAVFPEKLIETPIKAGCPEFVCKKCGKAREKLFDYERKPTRPEPTNSKYGDKDNDIRGGDGIRLRKEVKHIFKGYTDCGCNAGFEGGIVLDPFIGSGTTGKVAIKQRKHFIGFEINPEYVLNIADKRLENIQVKLL